MRRSYIAAGLISIIVLLVFYPTLSATVVDLDDTEFILYLNNSKDSISFKALLFPTPPVKYYRPLLILSYIIDCKIWQMEYSGYHLTNIVIHLFNVLIFYIIALKIFQNHKERTAISFFAALLFAVNPLTCESVAWISGRSDLLGTFFSLLAFLTYQSKLKSRYLLLILFVFMGLLSKENALAIIPVIIVVDFTINRSSRNCMRPFIISILLALPLSIYLYIRLAGFGASNVPVEIASSLVSITNDPAFDFLFLLKIPAIISFYIKKLIIPYPLNLIINDINFALYSILSILFIAVFCVFIIKKMYRQVILVILIIISFSPAILVAITNIAWSLYAERYLYLSITVWAVFVSELFFYLALEKFIQYRGAIIALMVMIVVVLSVTCLHRNLVWQDKVALWEDTYKKNPDNGKVLYKYGSVLKGDEGLPFFKKAVGIASNNEWKDLSLLVLADNEIKNEKYQAAVIYIKEALKINSNYQNCSEAINALKKIIGNSKVNIEENTNLLIDCYEKLYMYRPNPNSLYSLGLIYLKNCETDIAIKYFKKIVNNFSTDSVAKHAKIQLTEINQNYEK